MGMEWGGAEFQRKGLLLCWLHARTRQSRWALWVVRVVLRWHHRETLPACISPDYAWGLAEWGEAAQSQFRADEAALLSVDRPDWASEELREAARLSVRGRREVFGPTAEP